MSSKLFAFNIASAMQPIVSAQDDETTYNVDEQVWVGSNDVTANGQGTNIYCTFAIGILPITCLIVPEGCIDGPTSVFPSAGIHCDYEGQ